MVRQSTMVSFALAALLLRIPCTAQTTARPSPSLNGQFLRITVVKEGSFLSITDSSDGSRKFSGYLIRMLEAISREDRANFTYELLTPSGYGSMCKPQILLNTSNTYSNDTTPLPFSSHYHQQYHCATCDVTELHTVANASFLPTDIYLGMFYITQDRMLRNYFTIPFAPPYKGTPAMMGTTVRIRTIAELVEQQAAGRQPPACILGSSATLDFVQASFLDLQIKEFFGSEQDMYESIASGECPIHIIDAPIAAQFVQRRKQSGECLGANDMPIGIIGDAMKFGLSHYAVGVSKTVPYAVTETLSYWINFLMICDDELCPEGNLESHSRGIGTGDECGYVLFPPDQSGLRISAAELSAIVVGVVILLVVPLAAWHWYRIRSQKRRFKKRFVQQIARNIQIGPSPGEIPPDKLSEEILHIGQGKGTISKEDLRQWIQDIKMNFISEDDFNALWTAMDIDDKGVVDPVQFIVFLSACGPEFELVYNEQKKLPRSERAKLAARRLSNIALYGESGVRQLENKMEKRGWFSAPSSLDGSSGAFSLGRRRSMKKNGRGQNRS